MKLSAQEYATRYKITRQGAMKYFNRNRWTAADGVTWHAFREGVKWYAESEDNSGENSQGQKKITMTPEVLKAKKTLEEIRLLQQRNDKMRSDLMRDWTDCVYNAFIIFFGSLAGRITAMRLPQDQVNEINKILKEEVDKLQSNVDEQIREYEEANKARVR